MMKRLACVLWFFCLFIGQASAQLNGGGGGTRVSPVVPSAIPNVVAVQSLVNTTTFNEGFDTDCTIPCISDPSKYSQWKTNYYFGNQTNTLPLGLQSRSYAPGWVALDNYFVSQTGGDPLTSPYASGGLLHITADLMSANNQALYAGVSGINTYYSGAITTENSFSQQYGYFEITATMPHQAGSSACPTITPAQCLNSVPGAWPAFWLLPANKQGFGTNPEWDVLEHYGGQWIIGGAVAKPLTSLSWSGGTVTATASATHGITVGHTFTGTVSGVSPASYNLSNFTGTATGASTFTYPLASDPGTETVPGAYSVTSIESQICSANVVTVTTSGNISRTGTINVVITGASPAGYNSAITYVGTTATVTGNNTFTYNVASCPAVNTVPGSYLIGNLVDRVGSPVTTLHYGPIPGAATLATSNASSLPARIDLTQPHIFGFLWTPTEISTYIDQVRVFDTTDPAVVNCSCITPEYLLLSMVANQFPNAGPPSQGIYPTEYTVDYIRAWTLKP